MAAVAAGPASRDVLLIDTHNDLAYKILGRKKARDTDIERLRAGGVGAVFFAAYVAAEYAKKPGASADRARQAIRTIQNEIVAPNPETFEFARTADDIERVHRAGKIAALIGIEGGHAIENRLELLREFYDAGVRYMTLTHTNTNQWADSSGDLDKTRVAHHEGLTDFGRQVVHEMNRLGMIVDISHVADKTFWDVLETSRAPVFASHSSCRAISSAPRNMTDDMIRALAKKGGVIQINFACEFISQQAYDASKRKPKPKPKDIPRATLAQVVEHIDHAVKVGGIDAVGIGSDFDGIECAPMGLDDVSKFPNLTRALVEKGYKEEDIRKIYGANTLRLMRAVEAVSRSLGRADMRQAVAQKR
jgi:membrane dipeptidase